MECNSGIIAILSGKSLCFPTVRPSDFICLIMHRLLVFLAPLLLAGCDALNLGDKQDKFTLTVHSQGTADESPRSIFRMPIPGRAQPMIFKLVPEFSQHNITAFHSFPASDGNGYGVTVRLDFRAAEMLNFITRTKQGEILLAMVNGQPVDVVTIDRPVADGVYTIWEGVPKEVVDEMAKKYQPFNKQKSVSNGQDMQPTTRSEKKRVMERLEEEKKADAAAKKKGTAAPAPAEPPAADTDSGFPRTPVKPDKKGSILERSLLNRDTETKPQ